MERFAAMPPSHQLAVMLVGGLLATPLLLWIAQMLPATPVTFDDMEQGITAEDLEEEKNPSSEAAPETSPGTRLRRRGKRPELPEGATVIDEDEVAPVDHAAGLKLEETIARRAENVSGGVRRRGKDPFSLSDTERQRLRSLTQMLMPSLSEAEIGAEVESAIDRARADWKVRGDAALREAAESGTNPRTLARILDCGFVIAVLLLLGWVMHHEYGWQPMESLRLYMPREAAVVEGRAFTGEGGITSSVLTWLGLRGPELTE